MRKFDSYKDVQITVCAIMKNEEKFLYAFLDSVKCAHKIYLEDTGSDDNSLLVAQKWMEGNGFAENEKLVLSQCDWVNDFEFDKARNHILNKIPSPEKGGGDVILHIDIDNPMLDGWYEAFQKAVFEHPNFLRLQWIFDNGMPKPDRCHRNSPNNVMFISPLHETLEFSDTYKLESVDRDVYVSKTIPYQHFYEDPNKNRDFYMDLGEKSLDIIDENYYNRYYFLAISYEVNGYPEKALYTYIRLLAVIRDNITSPETLAILNSFRISPIDWESQVCLTIAHVCKKIKNFSPYVDMWFRHALECDKVQYEAFIDYAQWLAYQNRPQDVYHVVNLLNNNKKPFSVNFDYNPWYRNKAKLCQIIADAKCWEGKYDEAYSIITEGKTYLCTDKDIENATNDGFFSDYDFIETQFRKYQK